MQPDLREDTKCILMGPKGLGGGLLQHRKTLHFADKPGKSCRPRKKTTCCKAMVDRGKFPSKLLSFLFSVTKSFLCF